MSNQLKKICGTNQCSSDDDDYQRMLEGGDGEHVKRISYHEKENRMGEKLNLRKRLAIAKSKTFDINDYLNLNQTYLDPIASDCKDNIQTKIRLLSELGFTKETGTSTCIKLANTEEHEYQPIVDMVFRKNKQYLITKHSISFEQSDSNGNEEKKKRIFNSFLNVMDMDTLNQDEEHIDFCLKNYRISQTIDQKFIHQNNWYQIKGEKDLYFLELIQDDEENHNNMVMLKRFDFFDKQVHHEKYQYPADKEFTTKEYDNFLKSETIVGAMFVEQGLLKNGQNEQEKIEEKYVAFIHQHHQQCDEKDCHPNDKCGKKKEYYATIRKIGDMKSIVCVINLKKDVSKKHRVRFFVHHHTSDTDKDKNDYEIFHCQVVLGHQDNDVNYFNEKMSKEELDARMKNQQIQDSLLSFHEKKIIDKEWKMDTKHILQLKEYFQNKKNNPKHYELTENHNDNFKNLFKSFQELVKEIYDIIQLEDQEEKQKKIDDHDKIQSHQFKDFLKAYFICNHYLDSRGTFLLDLCNNLTILDDHSIRTHNFVLHTRSADCENPQITTKSYSLDKKTSESNEGIKKRIQMMSDFFNHDKNCQTPSFIMIDHEHRKNRQCTCEGNTRTTMISVAMQEIYIKQYDQLDSLRKDIVTQTGDTTYTQDIFSLKWNDLKAQMLQDQKFIGVKFDNKVVPNLILYKDDPMKPKFKQNEDYIELRTSSTNNSNKKIDFVFSSSKQGYGQNCSINLTVIIYESKYNHTLIEYKIFYEEDLEKRAFKRFTAPPELIGDTLVLFKAKNNDNNDQFDLTSFRYGQYRGDIANQSIINGLYYGPNNQQKYFILLNQEDQQDYFCNKVFQSNFRQIEIKKKEDQVNKSDEQQEEILLQGLISQNRFNARMLELFKQPKNQVFQIQDKFLLSLLHHETKFNMIQNPDQNIYDWINCEVENTSISIFAPLETLKGNCMAYIIYNFPQQIEYLVKQESGNTYQSFYKQLFENDDDSVGSLYCSHAQEAIKIQTDQDIIFNLKMKSVLEEIHEESQNKGDEPSIEIIFDFVSKHKSDMNQVILSCIVPILLQNKRIYQGIKNLFTDYSDDNERKELCKYFEQLQYDMSSQEKNKEIPKFFPYKQHTTYRRSRPQTTGHENHQFLHQNYESTKQQVLKDSVKHIDEFSDTPRGNRGVIFYQDLSIYNLRQLGFNDQKKNEYKILDRYRFLTLITSFCHHFEDQIISCSKLRSIIDFNQENFGRQFQYRLRAFEVIFKIIPFFWMVTSAYEMDMATATLNYWLFTSTMISQTIVFIIILARMPLQGGFMQWLNSSKWVKFGIIQTLLILAQWANRTRHNIDPRSFKSSSKVTEAPLCNSLSHMNCIVSDETKLSIVINVLITTSFAIDILKLARIFDFSMMLSILLPKVLIDLIPLIIFWFMWIVFFAIIAFVLGSDNAQAQTYEGLFSGMGYVFQSFENGIGPVIPPSTAYWNDHMDDWLSIVIYKLIFCFWILQQIFLTIILLNFVIAKVNDSYTDVMSGKTKHIYTIKNELNNEALAFYEVYYLMKQYYLENRGDKNFVIDEVNPINMIIVVDTSQDDTDSQWCGTTLTLKNYIKKGRKQVVNQLNKNQKSLNLLDDKLNYIHKMLENELETRMKKQENK